MVPTRQRPFAEPALAVLPFANLNGDPDKECFADGATDVLITELARIPALRVISRQSVLQLKGSGRRLEEIARELGVDGIVEGTVMHEGGRAPGWLPVLARRRSGARPASLGSPLRRSRGATVLGATK
jgi:TolB-like protein